jgi:hypothetical protein
MFSDSRFNCKTIPEVRKEFISTSKFKDKYPWRRNYREVLKTTNLLNESSRKFYCEAVDHLADSVRNSETQRYFSLSRVDKLIAATVIGTEDAKISTGDQGLIDFLKQQFDNQNVYPIELVVEWLQKELIVWSEQVRNVLDDWDEKNEKPQPKSAVNTLKKLTGFSYKGLTFED